MGQTGSKISALPDGIMHSIHHLGQLWGPQSLPFNGYMAEV